MFPQQGFFQSHTIGYLKIQLQECALLVAEHDSLDINLQQESETLSHVSCNLPICLIRLFSSGSSLERVSLLLILGEAFT